MSTIQELAHEFVSQRNWSPRQLAERSGINQLTINGLLNEGNIPRKAEHREYLRVVLGLSIEDWADALLESSNLPNLPDEDAPLQVLIAKHMFLQGLTERGLAKLSGIPYGTVLGVVRKGAIPRGNSLHRIGDALGLEPSLVAAALQRSGGNPQSLPGMDNPEGDIEEGLAPLVARRIRKLGLSIGSYAERLDVGYLQLSRFLDSGEPPEDSTLLSALRSDLGLEEDEFQTAIQAGEQERKPGTVVARKGEPPPDASQLQQALIRYLNSNKLTIKALSEMLSLSQITVSRLVKQGVRPARSRTHQQLRQLLGLSEDEYGDLLADRLEKSTTSKRVASEALTPKTAAHRQRSGNSPDHESTAALIAKTSVKSGESDEFEASTIELSEAEILDSVRKLKGTKRQSFFSYLQRLLRP
ncbi:MAG: hypothetical protein EA402_12365 [Planctomycetota bacterium]|nr:MAG: hypothetical protein EA402_12365 [Planctomycetota bacterium]